MTTEAKEWISFFVGAGIPKDVSAKYAMSFQQHRITMDMLLDLNKEYLKDMGIQALGDVIAILKYAKSYDEKHHTEKMLKEKGGRSNSPYVTSREKDVRGSSTKSSREPTPTTRKDNSIERRKDNNSIERRQDNLEGNRRKDEDRKSNSQSAKLPKPIASATKRSDRNSATDRLGPPTGPRKFADSSSAKESGVFSRLDDSKSSESQEETTSRSKVKDASSSPAKTTKTKRKKFIMVKTMSDGSQIREEIDPDDPILKSMKVVKKSDPNSIASTGGTPANVFKPARLGKKAGEEESPPRSSSGQDRSSGSGGRRISPPREPRKRAAQRITGPESNDRDSSYRGRADGGPYSGGVKNVSRTGEGGLYSGGKKNVSFSPKQPRFDEEMRNPINFEEPPRFVERYRETTYGYQSQMQVDPPIIRPQSFNDFEMRRNTSNFDMNTINEDRFKDITRRFDARESLMSPTRGRKPTSPPRQFLAPVPSSRFERSSFDDNSRGDLRSRISNNTGNNFEEPKFGGNSRSFDDPNKRRENRDTRFSTSSSSTKRERISFDLDDNSRRDQRSAGDRNQRARGSAKDRIGYPPRSGDRPRSPVTSFSSTASRGSRKKITY